MRPTYFPSDGKRPHRLFGKDRFRVRQNIHLRHQAEYELRSKLIQLRRLYIPASVSIEKLCDLMTESLSSFAFALSRGAHPDGRRRSRNLIVCVRRSSCCVWIPPFEKIFAIRATGEKPATDAEANDVFSAYMAQVEQVVEAVDERKLEETPDHKQTAQWLVERELSAGRIKMNHKQPY